MSKPVKLSPLARTVRRRQAEALRRRVDQIYRPQQITHSGTVLANSLVQVEGVNTDAIGAGEPGTAIPLVNFGRAADAIYRPATPEGVIVAAGTRAAGSGGGINPVDPGDPGTWILYHNQLLGLGDGDPHPQYLTAGRGDTRYYTRLQVDDIVGRANHDILDHTTTQSAGYLLRSTSGPGLGWIAYTSDGYTHRNAILATDANGRLTVAQLIAPDGVHTSHLYNPAGLLILEGNPDVAWRGLLASENYASNLAGIGLDADTGTVDARVITADTARFSTFVADVITAEAGALIVTKSRAQLAENFIVPAVSSTARLDVFELDGLPDYQPYADNDRVAVRYFNTGVEVAPKIVATAGGYDRGNADTDTEIVSEDFESYANGAFITDWHGSPANNALSEDKTIYLAVDDGAGNVSMGTQEIGTGYHTHYVGTGYAALTGYEVAGRFQIENTSIGIGITLLSDFPASATYYRISRSSIDPTLKLDGQNLTISGGTTDSDFDPGDGANVGDWIEFRTRIYDDGYRTRIQAKFWNTAGSEPSTWQIDAYDEGADRRTAGTFGFWGEASEEGYSAYIDDLIANTLIGAAAAPTVYIDDDFESYTAPGDAAGDWRDTETDNSMTEDDTLFTVETAAGNKYLHTTTPGFNQHSHWNGTGYGSLTDYEVTGRLRINNTADGVGITVFSQYGPGGTDAYYRVRRKAANPNNFEVDEHGTSSMQGTDQGTFDPGDANNVGDWIRFKIQATNNTTLGRSEIKARFWNEADSEPGTWDLDAYDDSGGRFTAGTVGLWTQEADNGVSFDDIRVESLTQTGGGPADSTGTVEITVPSEATNGDYAIATVATHSDNTITAPAGWTDLGTASPGNREVRTFRRLLSSEPATWEFSGDREHEINVAIAIIRGVNAPDETQTSAETSSYSIEVGGVTHGVTGGLSLVAATRTSRNLAEFSAPASFEQAGPVYRSEEYGTQFYLREYDPSTATGTLALTTAVAVDGSVTHHEFTKLSDSAAAFGTAWGIVVKQDPQPAGLGENVVAYDWTTQAAANGFHGVGQTIYRGTWALDYGVTGDASITIRATGAGAPYIDFVKHGADPSAAPVAGTDLMARIGELSGIAGLTGVGAVYYGDAGEVARFASSGMALENVSSTWSSGGNTFLTIDPTDGLTITVHDEAIVFERGYGFDNPIVGDIGGLFAYAETSLSSDPRYMNLQTEQIDFPSTVSVVSNSLNGKTSRVYLIADNDVNSPYILVDALPNVRIASSRLEITNQFGSAFAVFDLNTGIRTATYYDLQTVTFATWDVGANNYAPGLIIGRNSNATAPAAGSIALVQRDGTGSYIWPDNAGNLRIRESVRPQYNNDTSGTVVGTQTSRLATKTITGEPPAPADALALIAGTSVYRFSYNRELEAARNAGSDARAPDVHIGIATDTSPEFGQDGGQSFNPVSAFGYTVLAIQALQARIEQLEKQFL